MNFIEFENELNGYLKIGDIENAILISEEKLKSLRETNFHKILGRNLLNLSPKLFEFIDNFYLESENELDGNLKAISCELIGITINYDLWYINLFAFSTLDEDDNLECWLSEYDFECDKEFIISGLEDIQKVYEDYMKNKGWNESDDLQTQLDLSEIIIVLRLQELFKVTLEKAKENNKKWSQIPIFINGHDNSLICEFNK